MIDLNVYAKKIADSNFYIFSPVRIIAYIIFEVINSF